MPHTKKQLTRSYTPLCTGRQQAISFRLLPKGHIRGFDSRNGDGISEWQIYPPHTVYHTLSTCGQHQLLLEADKAITETLKKAAR